MTRNLGSEFIPTTAVGTTKGQIFYAPTSQGVVYMKDESAASWPVGGRRNTTLLTAGSFGTSMADIGIQVFCPVGSYFFEAKVSYSTTGTASAVTKEMTFSGSATTAFDSFNISAAAVTGVLGQTAFSSAQNSTTTTPMTWTASGLVTVTVAGLLGVSFQRAASTTGVINPGAGLFIERCNV